VKEKKTETIKKNEEKAPTPTHTRTGIDGKM